MTVSELIEHLKQFHPDLPVYTEDREFEHFHGELLPSDVFKSRIHNGFLCDEPGISHEAVII